MDGSFGIIFNENKTEILLVKRRDMPVWVLPGGGIEHGETPEQACLREVLEETGFNVEILRKVGIYTYKPGRRNHGFECKIIAGTKTLSKENKEIEYFSFNELPELRLPHLPVFIDDTLKCTEVVERVMPGYPFSIWKKGLRHPWALFKFLLTRIGIHWNI